MYRCAPYRSLLFINPKEFTQILGLMNAEIKNVIIRPILQATPAGVSELRLQIPSEVSKAPPGHIR